MATTEQESRTIEARALAWIVKARWDRKLNADLVIRVNRLMPGPDGTRLEADIALQDPKTRKPRLVLEVVHEEDDESALVQQLRQLSTSAELVAQIDESGAGPAKVGVLAPARLAARAEQIVKDAGVDVVEVW